MPVQLILFLLGGIASGTSRRRKLEKAGENLLPRGQFRHSLSDIKQRHRARFASVRRNQRTITIRANFLHCDAIVTQTHVGSKLRNVLVGVAQLVERRTVAPNVVGSNPIAHPKPSWWRQVRGSRPRL